MANERILVVDDEEVNLLIIEEFLSEEPYELVLYRDPELAWQALVEPGANFSLVILDRMMPRLDGIEFLRRMKRESGFADIPVVMQTAASSPEQVREGIEAGAYYYLTKPYEPETLLSLIRVAIEERRGRYQLRRLAMQVQESQRLLVDVEYRFVTLDDINVLVPALAALCTHPDVVAPGLADLMVNAVEHGNLGLSYAEKTRLKRDGSWEEEIRRRLGLPAYQEREARVRAQRLPDHVRFTISDQGAGFEWTRYLAFDPARAFDPNGRGIALARLSSFSDIAYQGCGNVVVATSRFSD